MLSTLRGENHHVAVTFSAKVDIILVPTGSSVSFFKFDLCFNGYIYVCCIYCCICILNNMLHFHLCFRNFDSTLKSIVRCCRL